MNTVLLSRISKDFYLRNSYRASWSGSLLISNKPNHLHRIIGFLTNIKKTLTPLEKPTVRIASSPKPFLPRYETSTFRPPWFFSRGAFKKDPTPIVYLLTESHEMAEAKPVPGNSVLLRSLCKGTGVLRQNGQGLIYLDVGNHFISSLLPFLRAYGLVEPPYFHLFGTPDGAHIPVIPARESSFHFLTDVEQIGSEFSFEVEGLYSLKPTFWPEVDQVWFFKVRSLELENMRRKYFLPKTPLGHPFHIAVAVKPKVSSPSESRQLPFMRINSGYSAA